MRRHAWAGRTPNTWGAPYAPPSAPYGAGEMVAYQVAPKVLAMPAVVVDVDGPLALIHVTWWPSKVSTVRAVATSTLRPWGREEVDAWDAARARTVKKHAEEAQWSSRR